MSEKVVKQGIKPCKAIMKTDFRLQQLRHTYDQPMNMKDNVKYHGDCFGSFQGKGVPRCTVHSK